MALAGEEYRLTFLDGLDAAILGLVEQFGMAQPVVLYDVAKVLDLLQAQGMSLEVATEKLRALRDVWLGEDTPAFAILDGSI